MEGCAPGENHVRAADRRRWRLTRHVSVGGVVMGHIHTSSAGLGHRISAAAFGSALGYLHHCVGRCCFSAVLHFLDQIDTGCLLLLWFGECLSLGASASSALFLLVVSSNLMPGGDPSPRPFPYKGSSPCMALDGETWSLDVLFKGVTIRFKRKVVVSGNFWIARLPSPLVPIPLA